MILIAVLLGLLFQNASCDVNQETVTYYENLIQTEINNSFYYKLPNNAYEYKPKSLKIKEYGEFDFIVIGSGSAGSVVASRLTEISNWTVLLLETGGDQTNFTAIPGVHTYLQGLQYNWNFQSIPQKTSCQGMVDKRCPLARGKVMGGTSTINGLVYSRGNRKDFDHWEQLGNPGWAYKDVLPLFRKSENSMIDGDPGYHGEDGYWHVEYHTPSHPELLAFLNATEELGYPVLDYNGRRQLGASRSQLNNVNGTRDSLAIAFIRPARSRPNIKLQMGAFVTKLLVHERTKKTYGVEFTLNNQVFHAKIRKEVIVSAGTIMSPAILMHSGIGPKRHLRSLGIHVIKDLEVGSELRDHPTFYGAFFQTNYTEPVRSLENLVVQYLERRGPLSIALNSQGVGFFQKQQPHDEDGVPDFELEFIPSNTTNNFLNRSFHYTEEAYNALLAKVDSRTTMNVYVIALHPHSVGSLRLRSKSPFEYPLIDTNYLSDKDNHDIETIYQGLQFLIKLVTQTKAFAPFNVTLIEPDVPGCRKYERRSRDYWFCIIRYYTMDVYHPISTCRMGPKSDKGAVVDATLKVHGIHNLRVADCSVIPRTTSGHTSAPAVMIGEKVSDLIKTQYLPNYQPTCA